MANFFDYFKSKFNKNPELDAIQQQYNAARTNFTNNGSQFQPISQVKESDGRIITTEMFMGESNQPVLRIYTEFQGESSKNGTQISNCVYATLDSKGKFTVAKDHLSYFRNATDKLLDETHSYTLMKEGQPNVNVSDRDFDVVRMPNGEMAQTLRQLETLFADMNAQHTAVSPSQEFEQNA